MIDEQHPNQIEISDNGRKISINEKVSEENIWKTVMGEYPIKECCTKWQLEIENPFVGGVGIIFPEYQTCRDMTDIDPSHNIFVQMCTSMEDIIVTTPHESGQMYNFNNFNNKISVEMDNQTLRIIKVGDEKTWINAIKHDRLEHCYLMITTLIGSRLSVTSSSS